MTCFLPLTVLLLALVAAANAQNETFPNLIPPKDSKVCYDVVGCFSNEAPWYTALRLPFPPRDPSNVSTFMFFINRANPLTKFQIFPDIDFSQVPFNASKQTFAIFHGWSQQGDLPDFVELAEALLRRVDANVFIIDYSLARSENNYFQVMSDIRVAGRLAGIVLLQTGIPPSRMHLIGHSLGAHAASYAANFITEKKSKPARLTGLDPANPEFEIFDDIVRFDETDAEFTDAVHTAGGRYGYASPCAHVDFLVDGGLNQPGCGADLNSLCSHQLSVTLYTKSLEKDGCIVGKKSSYTLETSRVYLLFTKKETCEEGECVSMGLGLEESGAGGSYSVPTNTPKPYICNDDFYSP